MNETEARIAAHICGDGWLTTHLEKNALHIVHGKRYYQNRIRYEMGYCNTRKELLKEFEIDMLNKFGLLPRRVEFEVRFRSKQVFERIVSLGGGNSRSWSIGKEIFASNKKIKKEWLRAFFDDECTFDQYSKRIKIKSINLNGLKQTKRLLTHLGISSNITGPNIDKTFYFIIPRKNVPKFYNKIGLKHKIKNERIKQYLKNDENFRKKSAF